jgi:hypothetical protein
MSQRLPAGAAGPEGPREPVPAAGAYRVDPADEAPGSADLPRAVAATDAGEPADEGAEERAYVIDLIPDELALARTQLASGLATLAEGVLLRRIARLRAEGRVALDEIDAAHALLAEACWRQGRPLAAGAAIERIRASSLERRRPLVMLMEAEALAARGSGDSARVLMDRVIEAVGIDEAWRLRGGVASRLHWPLPPSLAARRAPGGPPADEPASAASPDDPARTAAAHARLEAARLAFGAGGHDRGDRELMVALRLDPRIAADGVELLEPTLGEQPPTERLLLYGDLLRAAGRSAEASVAYDRAARA